MTHEEAQKIVYKINALYKEKIVRIENEYTEQEIPRRTYICRCLGVELTYKSCCRKCIPCAMIKMGVTVCLGSKINTFNNCIAFLLITENFEENEKDYIAIINKESKYGNYLQELETYYKGIDSIVKSFEDDYKN